MDGRVGVIDTNEDGRSAANKTNAVSVGLF
jgi:hypothetical protein